MRYNLCWIVLVKSKSWEVDSIYYDCKQANHAFHEIRKDKTARLIKADSDDTEFVNNIVTFYNLTR